MEVTATLRKLRIAPQKVRLVIDTVRGLSVEKAEIALAGMKKNAAVPVLKLIQSAAANATHNHNLQKDQLYIKTIQVDSGVTLHRWMPRAFGRATPIRKRSSHVQVVLDVKADAKAEARKQVREKDVSDAKAIVDAKTVVDTNVDSDVKTDGEKPVKNEKTMKENPVENDKPVKQAVEKTKEQTTK